MKRIILSVSILCLFLSSNVFAVLSGGGTQTNPYLIQSRADFDEFANPANASLYWTSGVYTKLLCNLDLTGTTYTRAVIAPDMSSVTSAFQGTMFAGVFDGNDHTISNLNITASKENFIGLFGYVDGGQIRNLGIVDINVTGGGYYVGGLAGVIYYYGSITNSYATGAVSGNSSVGGLGGVIYYHGSITNSYATSIVSGSSFVGGLVGAIVSSGSITNTYATGAVSGNSYVGGLVGAIDSSGSITNTYATGAVSGHSSVGGLCGYNDNGAITGSFWDKETSGQTASAGGTGKTTAEMKNINTFLSAGWDFAGETANGTQDIWRMIINGYPIHTWEQTFKLKIAELAITEGETATFEVVLPEPPTAEVAINLSISGSGDFELLTASPLIFNAGNWNIPQVVSVRKELDDNYLNDRATLVIIFKDYRIELPLREIDIQPEPPFEVIIVSSEEVNVPEGNDVSFTVMLAEDPLQPVEIHLTISGDPTISISSDTVLFFDSNNYAVPQTVTVKSRWEAGKKDTQAELLLSSPDLKERLFKTVTIIKKDKGKPFRLSKPPAWLDSLGSIHGANASHLGGSFNNPSDASWYSFRVASVPKVPAVPGHYGWDWISGVGGTGIWRWFPGKPAIPAKNRASFTFTSDYVQTASVWITVYQQVDTRYKRVKSKSMLLKPGKISSFIFVKKADVNYYVVITPAVSDLGSYSLSVTKAAIH